MRILTQYRGSAVTGCFYAWLEDRPEIEERTGHSAAAAVGELISSCPKIFNIQIKTKEAVPVYDYGEAPNKTGRI